MVCSSSIFLRRIHPEQFGRWVNRNAAWNSLTSLTSLDTTTMLSSTPYTTPLVQRLMREVISVAEAKGLSMHPVDPSTGAKGDLVKVLVDRALEIPLGSSMWNDLKANKRIEIEVRVMHQFLPSRLEYAGLMRCVAVEGDTRHPPPRSKTPPDRHASPGNTILYPRCSRCA